MGFWRRHRCIWRLSGFMRRWRMIGHTIDSVIFNYGARLLIISSIERYFAESRRWCCSSGVSAMSFLLCAGTHCCALVSWLGVHVVGRNASQYEREAPSNGWPCCRSVDGCSSCLSCSLNYSFFSPNMGQHIHQFSNSRCGKYGYRFRRFADDASGGSLKGAPRQPFFMMLPSSGGTLAQAKVVIF